MRKRYVPLVSVDFDGVIHSYTSGWQGPRTIPDAPVEGALKWIEDFCMTHCCPDHICAMAPEHDARIAIFSSRSRYIGGRWAIKKWLIKHGLNRAFLEVIEFPVKKPASVALLDDRAWCFNGTFPSDMDLIDFKPWHKVSANTGTKEPEGKGG
jgi:hypothetical protein